ncbi:MAG: mannitol dehydrogenase family protein [Propioniciclava sp.]|uniref:mannitol dehydrogenase family protein n=1 Tax=Propioniciclava sp. TaxID=2038686 RepID=UPI0039E654FA
MNTTSTPHEDSAVAQPGYRRDQLTCGIVHFGVGNFHRSHQAMYLDRLMNAGQALDWAICGVGVLPGDRAMRDALAAQDYRYTLVLKHPDGHHEARTIASIADYLFAPDDPEAVLTRLAAASTRIVSLTVTEGGYNIDKVTGAFDLAHPQVAADLAAAASGGTPTTVFGYVVEALRRRRDAGTGAFTVMSCDNIQSNGDVARRSFLAYAQARDPELAAWIAAHVTFPNSMVDRITPVTTDADRALVRERFGVADRWPVMAEPFTQWALEDHFCAGRPPFEDAGVLLVDDVEPYELMKLRLLNASHQALAYSGWLSGHVYASEAASDPLIVALLTRWMAEATPTLRPVPGIDLDAYRATLLERFANPEIRDTLARLCAETSDRIPLFLLPAVRENLAATRPVEAGAFVLASWARYAEGVDEAGGTYPVVDPLADTLVPLARSQGEHPLAFLANEAIFGELAGDEALTAPYLHALTTMKTDGIRAALTHLNDE